ncbi:MAG: class I SAM-dependent methyltransferase [Candidatus Nanopelagicales bacterium]
MTPSPPSEHRPEGPAARRWRALLESWAIPDDILARATEDPWRLPPRLFRPPADAAADPPDDPGMRLARAALPTGGSVLDVGCGAGASSLPLAPPAAQLTGVDASADMLAAFAAAAAVRGVDVRTVEGRWPDVADRAGTVDVVVCRHVLYNVPDPGPFAAALDAAARHRVVLVLGEHHPKHRDAPLWRHFHGLERPDGPTADDALAVLAEAGIKAQVARWSTPPRERSAQERAESADLARRNLCLEPGREQEVSVLLEPLYAQPRADVALWWDVSR